MKVASPKIILFIVLACSCLGSHLEFSRPGWTPKNSDGEHIDSLGLRAALRGARSVPVVRQNSVPILETPEYGHRVRPALKRLVQQRGASSSSVFFVSDKSEGQAVLVFWPEQNRIILFEPHTGSDFQDLAHSRRSWDLGTDVGPKEVAQTSTYLLTREMAEEMKRRCLQGTPFVIQG